MKNRNFVVASVTLGAALLVIPAIAKAATLPAACGAGTTQYKVSQIRPEAPPTPPTGQALIVLIQNEEGQDFASQPLSRLGIDGTWVGAVKGRSYIAIPVSAGSHKLCVSRQSSIGAERDNISTAPLVAQAGSVYYFEFTVNRQELGFAERENGGAGGYVSAPGTGSTPDMTAKRKDTVDTVTFTQLKDDAAPAHMSRMKTSVWAVK